MHLLFSKLKVLFWHLKFIAIKTEVKIPTLLLSTLGQSTKSARPMLSILGQSMASTKPVRIYMDDGVSLLRFKYPATLKNILLEM